MVKFFMASDPHGRYNVIRSMASQARQMADPKDKVYLILCGDVGTNFYFDDKDEMFKEFLDAQPITYLCLRGNHEERASKLAEAHPNEWTYKTLDLDELKGKFLVENKFPSILYFVDEGGEYEINGKKCLAVPGGYSVDKWYRLSRKWPWFADEQLTAEEMDALFKLAEGKHYDYVLSHTSPLSFEPYYRDLFLDGIDQSTVNQDTEKFLEKVKENITYDKWVFGHFHDHREIPEENAMMLFHVVVPF